MAVVCIVLGASGAFLDNNSSRGISHWTLRLKFNNLWLPGWALSALDLHFLLSLFKLPVQIAQVIHALISVYQSPPRLMFRLGVHKAVIIRRQPSRTCLDHEERTPWRDWWFPCRSEFTLFWDWILWLIQRIGCDKEYSLLCPLSLHIHFLPFHDPCKDQHKAFTRSSAFVLQLPDWWA